MRDWGWAYEYVKAMHLMLQSSSPKDYVIATGESHSLAEFAELIFMNYGLNFHDYVRHENSLTRPSDLFYSSLDPSLINDELGWKSTVSFPKLVEKLASSTLF